MRFNPETWWIWSTAGKKKWPYWGSWKDRVCITSWCRSSNHSYLLVIPASTYAWSCDRLELFSYMNPVLLKLVWVSVTDDTKVLIYHSRIQNYLSRWIMGSELNKINLEPWLPCQKSTTYPGRPLGIGDVLFLNCVLVRWCAQHRKVQLVLPFFYRKNILGQIVF